MSSRLASFFQIHGGEGRLVALFMALMLLPSAGAAIGLSSAESLFLSRVGADFLPRLYIVLGLVTMFTTLSITALLGRISPLRFYLFLPILLAVLLAAARILVGLDLGWIFGLLWIATVLFDTLQSLQTWGLAGMVFDTRQAKRLFPLLGAAGILGLTLGGLATRPLVKQLGTENLLLVWAALLLAVFGLTRILAQGVDERQRRAGRRGRVVDDLQAGYKYVLRSRLMRWIAVSAVLFYVLFFLLGFQFSKAVAEAYPLEDAMTGFLGAFRGMTTAVALSISLLLANRFYGRFGLMAGILTLAALDLAGFAALTVSATFLAIAAFRFTHESWLGGVTRTAWFALANVVPPTRREQTRMFINGVCLQAGVVLVGILLLVGGQVLGARQLYLIGVIAAGLTLFAVWRARKAYLGELVDALRAGRPQVFYGEENPFGRFEHCAAAAEVAVAGLSDANPAVRQAAAEVLGTLAVPETTQSLIDALDDADARVRAAVLRSLTRTKDASALGDVAALLTDSEPDVRVQAIKAVRQLANGPEDTVAFVQPLLDDPSPAVRSEAAVALLKTEPHPQAVQVLQEMVTADQVEVRVKGLDGFGAWGDAAAYDPSAVGLADPQPAVRRAAASALAMIENPRCPEPLVRALGDSDRSVREAAAAALGAIGKPALQPAVQALNEPPLAEGALLALAQLPVLSEEEAVRTFARQESASAVRYAELLGSIRSLAEQDDRTLLLAESLRIAAERHGANALRAVGLLTDRDAINVAVDNLIGPQPDQRANAIEILDSVADREIIRPVLPLWEPSVDATAWGKGRESTDIPIEIWLVPVLRDSDPWLRATAALVAGGVEEPQICTELAELAQTDPDPMVREVAAAALNGGSPMQTLATLSSMERIMFLRRVPLFVDLPPAELQQVAAVAEEFLFTDGETISFQDDPGDELYIIVSGEVSVVTGVNGEDKIELARRKPGEYVGEMAIISRQPRMASLVAVGDVRTLCIGQKQFEGILRERPETGLAVMRVLCERLRECEDHTKQGC